MTIRDQLIRKALIALDEVAERSWTEPVAPSYALRFALAYLYICGKGERWMHDDFWREMQRPNPVDGKQCSRRTMVMAAYQGIVRNAGLIPTIETLQALTTDRGRNDPEAVARRRLARIIADEAELRREAGEHKRKSQDCGWL